ncbi:MAG TPA: hypothetical protein VFI25_04090 [Planctomycetota bacterium]|nr:hypothetical protein [Planctomycetota bacterium]
MSASSGEERTLRLAYAACGVLAAGPLAWGALRGYPEAFLFLLPVIAGFCGVLLAVESSLRSLRSRIESLERRPPPLPPSAAPPVLPRGYDPGASEARRG